MLVSRPATATAAAAPPLLVLEGLGCERSGRALFRGVSLSLAPGEALVVTGRNGAGKSSLIAILAGRLQPAEGRVETPALGEVPRAEALHLVAHREGIKTALTATENLAFACDVLGVNPVLWPSGMAPEAMPVPVALARVGLSRAAHLPAGYLSAGQKRRLALARLLAAPRPLWLLDEPIAALDSAGQALVAELIAGQVAAGGAVVAATHQPLGLAQARSLVIGGEGGA